MISNIIKLIRPHQYIKNLFIFGPIFFAGNITDKHNLLKCIVAFIAFSISASSIYLLNDFKDIQADRKHPIKKFRPLASGAVPVNVALMLALIFSILGIAIMASYSIMATLILLIYIIMNIAYSVKLKHIAILDITIIAIVLF